MTPVNTMEICLPFFLNISIKFSIHKKILEPQIQKVTLF